jgi:tight adherence protein B
MFDGVQLAGWIGLLAASATAASLGWFVFPRLESLGGRQVGDYVSWVVLTRERMFRPVTPARVRLWVAIATLSGALFGYVLSHGYGWITLVFTVFLAWVGFSLPRLIVQLAWQQRIRLFDRQLIDALNLMANSLRSGLNLPKVIEVLVEEMPNPVAQEFGLVVSQQKLGLTIDEALAKMVDRVPSEDLTLAINSILILRETGGDLSETFEVIAATIRERRKVDGKIKAMTAQGKTQGTILFLMPFGLAALIYYLNPGFLTPLFTTRLGWLMILVMLFFQLLGGLWIRKVVTIDV